MSRAGRAAAVLLLVVWIGPVTWEQTGVWPLLRLAGAPQEALADPHIIPAGRAVFLEPGTPLRLRLRDGSAVEGRFVGRTLLDSAQYAPRFEAHSRSGYVPLALGETLHVALYDGRQWTAPFAGYGQLSLLLQSQDTTPHLRAPFEFVKELRRANGERVEPANLARAFRNDSLPSAEAITMVERHREVGTADWWGGGLRVPVQDIELVVAELPSRAAVKGGSDGAEVVGIILLSVVLSVALVFAIIDAALRGSLNNSGCKYSEPAYRIYGIRLTTRPFDRHRGCFEGDSLAAADPWPEPSATVAVIP